MIGDPNNDAWVYELDRGVQTRLTTNAGAQIAPVWSPDGSQIAFIQGLREGRDEFVLCTVAADGAGKPKDVYLTRTASRYRTGRAKVRYFLVDRGNIGGATIWALSGRRSGEGVSLVPSSFSRGPVSSRRMDDGRLHLAADAFAPECLRDVVFPERRSAVTGVRERGKAAPLEPDERRSTSSRGRTKWVAALRPTGSGPRFVVKDVRPLFRVNLYTGPAAGLYGYDVSPARQAAARQRRGRGERSPSVRA